jgi:hypothetical protein
MRIHPFERFDNLYIPEPNYQSAEATARSERRL